MKTFQPCDCDWAVTDYYESMFEDWYVSIKHDGICVYTSPEGPRTRNGKEIQNPYLRVYLETLPVGLHGEVCTKDHTRKDAYKTAVSLVMTKHIDKVAHDKLFEQCQFVIFNAFGVWEFNDKPYIDRLVCALAATQQFSFCKVIELTKVNNFNEAKKMLDEVDGEGLIMAAGSAPYYHGRCTKTRPYALKLKKKFTFEATIVGFEQEKYGTNLKSVPKELWGTPKLQAAKLLLSHPDFGDLKVGSGLTKAEKEDIYLNFNTNWLGQTAHVEAMKAGGYDKPRMPIYKGIRKDI